MPYLAGLCVVFQCVCFGFWGGVPVVHLGFGGADTAMLHQLGDW